MRLANVAALLGSLLVLPLVAWGRPPVTSLAGGAAADLSEQPFIAGVPLRGREFSVTVDGEVFTFAEPVMVPAADPGQGVFTGRPSVFGLAPAPTTGEFATLVLPYLAKSPEFRDVLKLRRTARHLRARELAAMIKAAGQQNERFAALLAYVKSAVGTPLIITERAPLPEYIRKPGAGPCNITSGAGIVVDGKTVVSDGNVICISDLVGSGDKLMFSVADAVRNDTLDIVLCHEVAHAIMNDLYGKAYINFKRPSNNGHAAPVITDLALAFIEGWAEAFEAVYGPANLNLRKDQAERLRIAEFLFERQDPVRRERYIWENIRGRPTGVLKNGLQMLCTEGVIAGILYDIMTSRAIAAPVEKILTVMVRMRPLDFRGLFNGLLKYYKDDRKVLLRILLENTNYVTMDGEAARLYQAYYQKKLAYQQKKCSRDEFTAAKQAFVSHKEALFAKAMAGADVFANVGPELWFSGLVIAAKPRELTKFERAQLEARNWLKMSAGNFDPNRWEFNLDLNTVTERMLKRIGVPAEAAAKLLAARREKGFFTGNPLDILKEYLGSAYGNWAAKLQIARLEDPYQANAIQRLMTLYPEDLDQP